MAEVTPGAGKTAVQALLGNQPPEVSGKIASFGGLQIEPDSKDLEANHCNTVVYLLYVAVVLLGFYLLTWHPSPLLKDKIVQWLGFTHAK